MTTKFAPQIGDIQDLVNFTDHAAQVHDNNDAARNPDKSGGVGTALKRLRDIMASGQATLPVINKTGGTLAANKFLNVSGYDSTTGRFTVVYASNATFLPAHVFTPAAILNGGTAELQSNVIVPAAGNTSTVTSAGDPLYLGTGGAFVVAAPDATAVLKQVVGYADTKAASGTVRVVLTRGWDWSPANIKAFVNGAVVTPGAAAGGDLAGTYPNPTVKTNNLNSTVGINAVESLAVPVLTHGTPEVVVPFATASGDAPPSVGFITDRKYEVVQILAYKVGATGGANDTLDIQDNGASILTVAASLNTKAAGNGVQFNPDMTKLVITAGHTITFVPTKATTDAQCRGWIRLAPVA